jgi:type II secretory pathway pseudopilin PulG
MRIIGTILPGINIKMKIKKNKNHIFGFTLVEVLLYVAIIGIVFFSVSIFISLTVESRIKSQVIAEVEQVGTQTMLLIEQTIRNSVGVSAPTNGSQLFCTSENPCSLLMSDVLKNPTLFTTWFPVIWMKEGNNGYQHLTGDKIRVSNFSFYNLSKTGTPGIIRIQFTLSYNTEVTGRFEYNYSKTFYGSASLRK